MATLNLCAFFIISVCLNIFTVSGDVGNIWGYSDGLTPQGWPTAYPECGGHRQSPINIDTSSVVYEPNLQLFDMRELRSLRESVMTIQNHGKTVEIDVHDDHFLHGGSLPGRYKIKQFHFHWGTADRRGSEHDLNGRQYPMEMHIVSYNTRYPSFHAASNATGGLAVLSFLIEIGNDDNRIFEDVCHHFANIIRDDQNVTIENFQLTGLFPRNVGTYYRYYGSLTTPPCHESVMWTVFRHPIIISKSQIDTFRVLGNRYINNFHDIKDNFRPLQALHGRKIYTNEVNGIFPRTAANQPRTITRTVTSTRRRVRLLPPAQLQQRRRQSTNSNAVSQARVAFPRRQSTNANNNAAQFRRIPTGNQRQTVLRTFGQRLPSTRTLQSSNRLMQRLGRQIRTEVNGVNNNGGDQLTSQRSSQRTRQAVSENKPLFLLYNGQLIRWSPSARGITRGRLTTNNRVRVDG